MNINRITRNLHHVFLYPFRYLPEGTIKEKIKHQILSFQNSVPLYLVLKPGDTAIQVGTPNSRTVKRFSNLVGKTGKVFIIEADPDNGAALVDNLKYLTNQNVTIINKGAWSEKANLTFYKSDDFKGDNKIPIEDVIMDGDFRNEYSEKITIKVDTLDNLLKEKDIKTFNYLSVTVNGAEYEVLKGAKNLLTESNDAEVFSKGHARIGDAKTGAPIHTIIKPYLEELGYSVIISRGENPNLGIEHWKKREGDVFGKKGNKIQ